MEMCSWGNKLVISITFVFSFEKAMVYTKGYKPITFNK